MPITETELSDIASFLVETLVTTSFCVELHFGPVHGPNASAVVEAATSPTALAPRSRLPSPLAVTDVYALLRKASAGGTAIVLVEQNVNRALSESDRFYCLQKGRVMLEGESAAADRAKVAQAYFGI